MKVNIKLNIEKKYAFAIIGLLVVIAGIVVSYAFGGSDSATMGHSIGEIDWGQEIPKTVYAKNFSTSGYLASTSGVWTNGWIWAGGRIDATGDVCGAGKCLSTSTPITIIRGSSPQCSPPSAAVMRFWDTKTCQSTGLCVSSCNIIPSWNPANTPLTCTYPTGNKCLTPMGCFADTWSAVLCAS
jgi:hypothetical protein